jgi:hypothetical protein
MLYNLKPPIFDQSTYLGFNIGIRPARKTGPRLQKEAIGDKIVYHNYGHAGYGVAMSWGSCKIMTTMFGNEFGPKYKHVAVVGSGYMGLHTAKQLTNLGYKVTVYTKTMPSEWGVFGENVDKKLTSQVAAGLIELAYMDDLFHNRQQLQLIYDESLRYISSCYEKKTYPGFFKRDVFYMEEKDPTSHLHPGSYGPVEKCKVTFGNGRHFDALKSWTYNVDGDIYLNALVKDLYHDGVRFVTREFKDQSEILRLNETVIFNCTGFQSKYLFNDDLVYAKKGIMLAYKNPNNVDYYINSGFTKKVRHFSGYPMNNRYSVGLTWIYEEDITPDQDKHHRDLMAEVVQDFNQQYIAVSPKL